MKTITLPLDQAQALRAYCGSRPHDEVAAACTWLDDAIRFASVPPFTQPQPPTEVSDRDREMDDLAYTRQ